jgi:hypothetical protein
MAAAVAVCLGMYRIGPRVPGDRVAPADADLVRDEDRASWRKVRQRAYNGWKRQDDFYRVAAYKKAVESGLSAAEAKAAVRRDFPFYYTDPATREDGGYVGDDAGLPIVLRERVNRRAHLLKPVMADLSAQYPTMNALVRQFIRKGTL